MELKDYQKTVIADLTRFLALLRNGLPASKAYERLWNEKKVRVGMGGLPFYQNTLHGVPNVCLKVPTGGGKTFIAASAIKPIFDSLPFSKTKAVVWLVPSDAILEQTLKNLSNPRHPYRQRINGDFSHRVEVYDKSQLLSGQNFNPTVVHEQLSVFVLSYDSFRTKNKEGRKAYQENGNLAMFAKFFDDPSILLADTDETALIQVIRYLNPVVVVDESHHATTPLSKEMLQNFNPAFVLDLTATPKKDSNIISYVDALQLKKENMVKLPVIVYNRHDKDDVISDAITLRDRLERKAEEDRKTSGRYIRPIVLFQAEPRGKDTSTTFERLKKTLVDIGVPESWIAIKTADKNELRGVDLLSEDCPIRYIITVNALKEGWDCPFAYVLATIANRTSTVDVEQILGRILRLPDTKKNASDVLNISYAITSSADFQATLSRVVAGLNNAGFSDKDYRIGTVEEITAPISAAEQTSLGLEQEEADDFSVDVEAVKERLAEAQTPAADANDAIFAEAIKQASEYEQAVEQSGNPDIDFAPLEVRPSMNTFRMKEEFVEEAMALRLPQFVLPLNLPSFFSDDKTTLLTREALTQGFTLRDKDTIIDFSTLDAEIARVDIEETKEALPRAWKLQGVDNRYFREWLETQPSEKRLGLCKSAILGQLTKMNAISDKELREYVTRVISGMAPEMLDDLQRSPYIYGLKIRKKIERLLDAHTEKTFDLWIEQGRITCEPSYALKPSISPLHFTSVLPNSLYSAEEEMNGLEQDVVWELANMENIKWWHRNMSRSGFNINGYINAFPDILAMTKNGILLAIEPKGDHLENSDSRQKAAVGKAWERMAGRGYRYYMVFREKDLKHEGTVRFDRLLEIVRGL
jgi:type III restriction enzyme